MAWLNRHVADFLRDFNYQLRANLKGFAYTSRADGAALVKGGNTIVFPKVLFHDVLNNFDSFFALRENKQSVFLDLTKPTLTLVKGDRKLIFESNYSGERALTLKNFDYFCKGTEKIVDFSSIDFMGFKIKTTPAMILEVPYALLKYNKYVPLGEGDVVFDFGAYHGTYALYASKKIGRSGLVYAFEPDSRNYSVLKENLERNNIKNVIPIKEAVSGAKGNVYFSDNGAVDSAIGPRGGKTVVKTNTIEGFYEELELRKLNFVKMDVEGEEVNAVKSSIRFLSTKKPALAIASYHFLENTSIQTYKLLEPILQDAYKKVVTDTPEHLTTYAFNGEEQK